MGNYINEDERNLTQGIILWMKAHDHLLVGFAKTEANQILDQNII